jgi:transcriptional regulator with XRE-family HTH domain
MKEFGKKLKALRLTEGMTLKQLASKARCTDAYLSQMERGLANPSVMILKNVASALGVTVVDFFLEPRPEDNDVVVKEKDRIELDLKRGNAKIQMLVRHVQNKRMQPFYNLIEPGGGSRGSYSHIGEEFGIVLQGRLRLNLDGKIYEVKKGESFYFSSQTLHSWLNPGKTNTVVIWVTSPPTF